MSQTAYTSYVCGTATEMLVAKGKTDSGRELEICISKTTAVKILTEAAAAYAYCGHVGHAMWHMENNNTDFENCATCKHCRDEKK